MRNCDHDTPTSSQRSANRLATALAAVCSGRRLRLVILALAVLAPALLPKTAGAQNVNINWDTRRAFEYLQKVCEIGPRVSGTDGMLKQQTLIIDHFRQFGCEIRAQAFDVAHPQTGVPVRMTNLVISFDPSAKQRVVLGCHYDTRPFPDQDRVRPRGPFIGANDGASGVALFMEMAHHMKTIKPRYGVDFVLFDGEELVYDEFGKYFLGSEYFARWYRDNPPDYQYVCGVVADMVADKNLELYIERNSWKMAPKVTQSLWATARNMQVKEFVYSQKYEIRDDHLALNEIAGIPTADIIDFDYPYWHTTRDTARSCSATSLAKVGRVLLQWLTEVPIEPGDK
ncbi:MAG: M28 family peptidase [Rhodopirellula sp.]|nr:M28 family peptidase [Rhodopirellula sp.]